MALIVQHTVKNKFTPILNVSISINEGTFLIYKKEDRFNKVYDSDGRPGILCDMEDLEDTQYFDDYYLPDVPPTNAGKFSLVTKVINLLWKEGKSQMMIHLIQCKLKPHNINSKI